MGIPATHITIESASQIKKIVAPLARLGDIQYFCYGVNYPNTSCFTLTTQGDYFQTWFKHLFPLCGFHLPSGWHSWESTLPQKQIEVAKEFGFGQGIHFIQHQEDKTEIFGFASHPGNKNAFDFYLNNTNLLKRFSRYFLAEAQNLIQAANDQLITPPKEMVLTHPPVEVEFNKKEIPSVKSFFNKIDYPFNLLSTRESQCFSYLIQGFTNSQIGEKLGLSSKTIDVYINRIKKKLGCSSKNEINTVAANAGVIEYHFDLDENR